MFFLLFDVVDFLQYIFFLLWFSQIWSLNIKLQMNQLNLLDIIVIIPNCILFRSFFIFMDSLSYALYFTLCFSINIRFFTFKLFYRRWRCHSQYFFFIILLVNNFAWNKDLFRISITAFIYITKSNFICHSDSISQKLFCVIAPFLYFLFLSLKHQNFVVQKKKKMNCN